MAFSHESADIASMITEKATDRLDLPHAALIVDHATLKCECGRPAGDELHDRAALTEKAGAQPAPLITEKGV